MRGVFTLLATYLVLLNAHCTGANYQKQAMGQADKSKSVHKSSWRRSFLASNYASSCIAGTFLAFPYKNYAFYCVECGGGFFSNTSGKSLNILLIGIFHHTYQRID